MAQGAQARDRNRRRRGLLAAPWHAWTNHQYTRPSTALAAALLPSSLNRPVLHAAHSVPSAL
eukprot:4423565-Pleurochrysis_carterae.AAC.1